MLAQDLRLVPGGKGANQAYAMGRLGGCAAMLGAVGADLHGQRLKQNLSKVGVDVSALKESQEQPTGMAVITVLPHGDNSILVLPGANSQVTPAYVQQHLDLLEACDYVVFQLEIPLETVVYAAKEASRLGKKVILDPAPAVPGLPEELLQSLYLIKPNETELSILTGRPHDPARLREDALSLQARGVKEGWMYSPVTGGGTASVEFEYLTGFSTLFQPPHTVAYQLYVEEGMPSLAALAGSQGYETTAFHPYLSSGWNRPIAYQCLSFDHQLYQEDVEDPYLIRRYISDRSDYETIFDVTGTTSPAFVFNVTMQNHSGYAQGWNNLTKTIRLSTQLRTADSSAEQYIALAQASDDALEELIGYYSQVEEPTLIVFFGDHQPPLKNDLLTRSSTGKKRCRSAPRRRCCSSTPSPSSYGQLRHPGAEWRDPQPQLSGGAHRSDSRPAPDGLHELPGPDVPGAAGDHAGGPDHRGRPDADGVGAERGAAGMAVEV